MNANHRIVWLDIAKGIAICLMVLGHTRIFFGSWQETFLVVAFFPIVIMLLNHFYPMPSILKYLVFMLVLIVIVYLKNLINNMCKTKIL